MKYRTFRGKIHHLIKVKRGAEFDLFLDACFLALVRFTLFALESSAAVRCNFRPSNACHFKERNGEPFFGV